MSVYAGPNTTQSGLVLHIDPSNPRCYPGSGSTLFDLSGGGNNGTLTNGASVITNRAGRALDFDGTDDFVVVGLPFGPASSGLKAISLWCYLRSSSTGYLVANYDASSNGFSVLQNSDRTIGIARTGTTNNVQTVASIALLSWTHLFVEINATGVVWINGKEAARGAMLSELTSTNAVRISGRWVNPNSNSAVLLNAQLDDVRFYNRALSDSEILNNFNATRGRYGI